MKKSLIAYLFALILLSHVSIYAVLSLLISVHKY